jgi:hypothetical protein
VPSRPFMKSGFPRNSGQMLWQIIPTKRIKFWNFYGLD